MTSDGKARHAVLAEDDPTIRNFLRLFLEKEGLVVHEAVDGQAALACVLSGPPDVLVTDLSMPRMNGVELIQAVRGHRTPWPAALPIVAVSGAEEGFKERAREAGANEVLSKPVLGKVLVAAVRRVLGG